MRKRTLSLILATGILMTMSVSFAAFSVTGNISGASTNPGAIQVTTVPSYLNYLFTTISCEGIHYYSDGNELMDLQNTIDTDGIGSTDKDNFTISFTTTEKASVVLAQINNSIGGNAGCTGTIDFVFSFPESATVDINALVDNADAYFQYRPISNPNEDLTLPLSNWHVENNRISESGTERTYLKGDTANKTITLSVLITDHTLGGATIPDDYYLYSFADVLTTYIATMNKYSLVLDFDLSKMENLTLADFSGVTLSITTSKGV